MRPVTLILTSLALTIAFAKALTSGDKTAIITPEPFHRDIDGDGFVAAVDCDDRDNKVYPGAAEVCDGADNDCDGAVDDGVEQVYYADLDGDGYGDEGMTIAGCGASPGYVSVSGDCDDGAANRFPGAEEVCGDGVVNDCDGSEAAASALCSRLSGDISVSSADREGWGTYQAGAPASISDVGDVDGDGLEDLLVGVPNWCYDCTYDTGWEVGASEGIVAYLRGAGLLADVTDTSFGFTDDVYLTSDGKTSHRVGAQVGGLGDLNTDGYDDVFITAPGISHVYVRLGASAISSSSLPSGATLILRGEAGGDSFGSAAANIGDLTGDGLDELAVGARYNDDGGTDAGAVTVFSGAKLGKWTGYVRASKATLRIVGSTSKDYVGSTLGNAGDIDGDGVDDLLIGAPCHDGGASDAGAVAVFLGGGALAGASGSLSFDDAEHLVLGAAANDRLGSADMRDGGTPAVLSTAGDVDGDGLDDVLLGATEVDLGGADAGAAYLLLASGAVLGGASATASVSDADVIFVGEAAGDHAGFSVGSAGDLDGDGLAELLVGAPFNGSVGRNSGAVYVLYGDTLTTASGAFDLGGADARLVGKEYDTLGMSLLGGVDASGDGVPDLLVGGADDADYWGALWMFFGEADAY
ncbi:hypothetical protein L6R46_23945 [Myxococcota bacterium]|nr:hypothetical protein [Myxococcota bacterium]